MSKELVKPNESIVADLQNTHQLCQMLLKTPHYAKMGAEGVFAIIETSKSLGIDPRQALGGGLYYVKGKVEMSARQMNSLIRSKKHSITRDRKSDDTVCILHGKRVDNGDTWTESFSLEEAKRAGLANNPVWKNFPRDMLFARALSRLARQLFPDIIGNVYVEGEISLDPNITQIPTFSESSQVEIVDSPKINTISNEQAEELDDLIGSDQEYRQTILNFIKKKFNIDGFSEMPLEIYQKVYARAFKNYQDKKILTSSKINADMFGEIQQMAMGG